MQASIESFSPITEVGDPDFQNYTVNLGLDQSSTKIWSILYRKQNVAEGGSLNAVSLQTLSEIERLENNWDEQGAVAPNKSVIQWCNGLIVFLEAIGQKVFSIAPGPDGEIMLDLRNGSRSLEILIYGDRMKYVKFSPSEKPVQGIFTPDLLNSELIAWVNMDEK